MTRINDLKAPETSLAQAPDEQGERGAVTAAAVMMAFGTLLSRILGLVRDMVIARYFPNDIRDAFLNAFRLPNLFRRLLGEGSLSVSFIPVFVHLLQGHPTAPQGLAAEDERAHRLISAVFTLLLSVTIVVSLLAIIFMDDILRVLLSGAAYLAVPGKLELTIKLARIMFGFLIFISLYAFFMAILNGLRKFALTALAPCLFNIVMIMAAMSAQNFSVPEAVLAWAVLLGGCLQMLILVPAIARAKLLPRISFQFNSSELKKIAQTLLPSLFGTSIMQMTAIVNMYFASRLPSGSPSYLYLGDRILELPLSLFVVSVSSALLPTLAYQWAQNQRAAMAETVNHYVRLILFIAIPAAIGMFVLSQQIVDVLFLGKEFKYVDAIATSHVIQVYALTVVSAAGVRILAQGFYAIHNTWFPALSGVVALIVHVAFAFALSSSFGVAGLAGAAFCSATVNLIMLATGYNAWIGALEFKILGRRVGLILVCGAVMAGVLRAHVWLATLARSLMGGHTWVDALSLAVSIALAITAYLLSASLLKIPEYRESVSLISQRAQKIRRTPRASS